LVLFCTLFRAWALFCFVLLWELGVPSLSLFLQVLDIFGSGYAVSRDGLSLGCGLSHLLSTEMVFDAWASFGCLCIALDALRIVWDVLCIVFDAWASFDACASCVEPGAPWVTEAFSFAVFFIFFQSLDFS